MLEVNCTALTPEVVLVASGHVERFTDLMVKDEADDRCYRADKLLAAVMDEKLKDPNLTPEIKAEYKQIELAADSFSAHEIHALFQRFAIKAPESGNDLSYPEPFNLMFGTYIGPTGKHRGFLRPETAQGIFVNFKSLYEFNRNKLPFAAAQIGSGFRNEISPRDGLLRVREFTMAEIEHFVNPKHKDHPKFSSISSLQVPLYSQSLQLSGQEAVPMHLGSAVEQGMINNQTLAYFMGRTYLFLTECGVKSHGIRFRQHLPNEMAHYAQDCWDCEILTSYGWVECVGIADRSCFDLSRHSDKSKKNLMAAEVYPEPITVDFIDLKPNKGAMGKTFKNLTQAIIAHLEGLTEGEKESILQEISEGRNVTLKIGDQEVTLDNTMINPQKTTKKIGQETFYPSVIEPSFGIGRVLYAILEHSFQERKDLEEKRAFLSLPARIAPVKCSILPLSNQTVFEPFISTLRTSLTRAGLSTEVDASSSTIGRRYARTDEIGIPFGITIDFQTLEDETVTLREINSMEQVRIPLSHAAKLLTDLTNSFTKFEELFSTYPRFSTQQQTV